MSRAMVTLRGGESPPPPLFRAGTGEAGAEPVPCPGTVGVGEIPCRHANNKLPRVRGLQLQPSSPPCMPYAFNMPFSELLKNEEQFLDVRKNGKHKLFEESCGREGDEEVNCESIDRSKKHVQDLDQGVPPLVIVDSKPCKPVVVTKEGGFKGPTTRTRFEDCNACRPRCSFVGGCTSRAMPRVLQHLRAKMLLCHRMYMKSRAKGLMIATPADQDALLSVDVPREPCQGSGPLKAQKSGQAKEVSGTAGFKQPKTQMNKRKAKADVKEKEGTTVLEQHNVKKLKKMKEVGVREVAFERKLPIDELEKVSENTIALKRDGMKKNTKKHVEKGLEDKGPLDKALTLVGSSKRPKLQVKRAKQSGASCSASTTLMLKTSNEKPYVEAINGGKLVRICWAEPPCASCNTLMEKQSSRMMQHLKKVHGLDVFIPQRRKGRPRGSVNRDVPKSSIRDQVWAQHQFKDVNQKFSVNRKRIEEKAKHRAALTWDVLPRKVQKAMKKDAFIMEFVLNHMKMVDQKEEAMRKEIKSHVEEGYKSRVSSMVIDAYFVVFIEFIFFKVTRIKTAGGVMTVEIRMTGLARDGGGDDDFEDGSDDDADDDDGGSDVIGGGDDKANGEDDGTDDEDNDDGSDKGDNEGVIEHDDAQDVGIDEDEVLGILSLPASFLA
ncbi:hypothetical protein L7F22_065384 [Adiantum nelumboides]|nr:hypothetical protein [Adiantum nelumboides]